MIFMDFSTLWRNSKDFLSIFTDLGTFTRLYSTKSNGYFTNNIQYKMDHFTTIYHTVYCNHLLVK